jgi:hypothetical protein
MGCRPISQSRVLPEAPHFNTLLLQTYFFIRSETQSQKGMTSQQISDGFWDKVEAHLRDDAQNRADEQKALWEKTRPKRELESYIMEKLAKDDKVAQQLMEEAYKISLELSKTPLNSRSTVLRTTTNTNDFAPTAVLLSSFRVFDYSSPPGIDISGDTSGHIMKWSLTTGFGDPTENITSMLVSQAQPPPGLRRMTISAQPDIDFSYGNHGFGYTRTHSWIGIYVGEWDFSVDPAGRFVQRNVDQHIDLWDLQTNHDFSDRAKPALQAVDIPVVDNHLYVIAVQCSGAVEESGGISYASLSVTVDAINVNFA